MTAMADSDRKPLMRSLGEFVGHIVKGIRTRPDANAESERTVISETMQEEQHGNVILRRTTIEEVEVRSGGDEPAPETTEPPVSPEPPRA